MAGIKTQELLDKISKGDYKTIRLTGSSKGSFYMMLECEDVFFIHQNPDDTMKEYPKVDYALTWLKRVTNANRIVVDIQNCKERD